MFAKQSASDLAAETEKVKTFSQGVAQQQQGISHQLQAVKTLGPTQIGIMASLLKPYAGQAVSLHLTSDTTVGRLASEIQQAFGTAGIRDGPSSGTYMGALFEGITVVVHADSGHPALADGLVRAFLSVGINVKKGADPTLKPDEVVLLLGPD